MKGLNDPEVIALRNRIILGVVIALIFVVPFTFFFINKLTEKDTKIVKEIKNGESMIILVSNEKVSNEVEIDDILSEVKIKYYKTTDQTNKYYESLLKNINMTSTDIVPPTVIYIKDGNLTASLVDIKNISDLILFLENYGLK